MPKSARIDFVIIATPGVGIGPNKKTSIPIDKRPDVIACSIIYPDKRVSLPITTLCLCSPLVKYLPSAIPNSISVLPFNFLLFALALIPSVPKYFLFISYLYFYIYLLLQLFQKYHEL